MEISNRVLAKCKGLKNGKEWEYGIGRVYKDGLALIQRGDDRFYVFKDSLSSFTGITNSTGQEIYEGDLLEAEKIDAGKKIKYVQQVIWDQIDQQWKVEYFLSPNKIMKEVLDKDLNKKTIGHVYTHEHLIKPPFEEVKVKYKEKVH